MSKIGRKAISIPSGVTVTVTDTAITVKGPKGELVTPNFKKIKVEIKDEEVLVTRTSEDREVKALHGLVRSLVNNTIIGVTEGYKKTLKLVGTGYRAQAKGAGLSLSLGFSHPVDVSETKGVKFTLQGTDTIIIEGIDKHLVGQVAANVRKLRPPEPYQGKGIKYEDEVIRRKQGKAAA
ncbi:MAG: large subunit ribosomal protein [Patescibacteria group bacterium]|nr:large subunit ribosomal protein [Patescibacteria group bacterium]